VTMPSPREIHGLANGMEYVSWWQLQLSKMAGRQLPFFSLLVPAWLVFTMAGWRGMISIWPALLVCGGSFAAGQFLVANFIGPALVDVVAGLFSLAVLTLFLRTWKPKEIWHFPHETTTQSQEPRQSYTRRQIIHAWIPWILLSALVFACG